MKEDIKTLQLQLMVSQRDHLSTSQHLMQFQIEALSKQIEELHDEIESDTNPTASDNGDGNGN